MKPAAHPSALRVQRILHDAGLKVQVVEFEQPTRTCAEAATAVGCSVAEIAKSVVFRAKVSGQAVVVVASGDNRVCEQKVSRLVGEKLGRADANFVRASTGYAIGGVSPLGHAQPVHLILDADLLRFDTVWAAAGTPNSVFPLSPSQLEQVTGVTSWSDVRLDT